MSDAVHDELLRLLTQTSIGRWMTETELPADFHPDDFAQTAHAQAQRLAAMWPQMPALTPVQPSTLGIEDAVNTWLEGASEEAQATMFYVLGKRGWTRDAAQRVRDRMNRR